MTHTHEANFGALVSLPSVYCLKNLEYRLRRLLLKCGAGVGLLGPLFEGGLHGNMWGIIMRVIKGDSRSLDYFPSKC